MFALRHPQPRLPQIVAHIQILPRRCRSRIAWMSMPWSSRATAGGSPGRLPLATQPGGTIRLRALRRQQTLSGRYDEKPVRSRHQLRRRTLRGRTDPGVRLFDQDRKAVDAGTEKSMASRYRSTSTSRPNVAASEFQSSPTSSTSARCTKPQRRRRSASTSISAQPDPVAPALTGRTWSGRRRMTVPRPAPQLDNRREHSPHRRSSPPPRHSSALLCPYPLPAGRVGAMPQPTPATTPRPSAGLDQRRFAAGS